VSQEEFLDTVAQIPNQLNIRQGHTVKYQNDFIKINSRSSFNVDEAGNSKLDAERTNP
jgi:hypothetical protein